MSECEARTQLRNVEKGFRFKTWYRFARYRFAPDVLNTHRFNSAEDLEQTLLRYVALYNHQFPQSALKSKTPVQTMKAWYESHPHLFGKRPYDRPGCDT